jgi:putative ABC transport system substrate-binding protein
VTAGTGGLRAAKAATSTIPIVFATASDPVGNGLVQSLARPGGNATGMALMIGDNGAKQLELLVAIVPRLTRVGILFHPKNPAFPERDVQKRLEAPARELGVAITAFPAGTDDGIAAAFAEMSRARMGAVLVLADYFFADRSRALADLAARHRMPLIGNTRILPSAGALMSYGQNVAYNHRRAADYVDRIFKGTRPGDIPVEQPTEFELVLNRRAAKALGLEIPAELLVLAAEVIG